MRAKKGQAELITSVRILGRQIAGPFQRGDSLLWMTLHQRQGSQVVERPLVVRVSLDALSKRGFGLRGPPETAPDGAEAAEDTRERGVDARGLLEMNRRLGGAAHFRQQQPCVV